ncbi:hypothetical protein ScPMuIL_013937 [Solemya velum]
MEDEPTMARSTATQLLGTAEFSQKSLVKKWLACYQNGELLSALKQHWKSFVLHVFNEKNDIEKTERFATKFLLVPMEEFLCNGNPEQMFDELKKLDQPSQLCGKVFKIGEPTYSCRDCANDPTCVLCIDCFQKSDHRKHRYRMGTSGGAGYCDCGDPEAWKSDPFCEKHLQQHDQTYKNPMELLSDDLIDRASTLFMSTLQYTVEMLTWEQSDSLPTDIQPEGELDDSYVTMMFNDELHTYEQVINTLQKAVDCTHKEAVDFATMVDREGRSGVRYGTFSECEKARTVIERNTRLGSKPLKVQVMHTTVVSHHQFALRMINWLQKIISKSDGLRHLFCVLSMKPQANGQDSLMEKMLLADTQLWKAARVSSHQLLMSGVLMDQECKKQFAIIFTKWYRQLMHSFSLDDHDHEVSVSSLSVQIYTVPSLARMLITDHNLLRVILSTILQACEDRKNKNGKLSFDRSERNPAFRRSWYIFYDLKYALTCKPNPDEWTDTLRESFHNGLLAFIELLKLMQGMDAVTRQTGQHLEFEPEWEGAFNLQLKLEDNIALFLEWCGSDPKVLVNAYRATVSALVECQPPDDVRREDFTVAGKTAQCIKYSVSTQPVSIHIPVTRFLAGLHVQLGKYGLSVSSSNLLKDMHPSELIELSLRSQVMIAQTQAGMWRRNGYSLLNQIFFYHNVKCRAEMYDKDIVMLQVGTTVLDSNEYILQILHRYGLTAWIREEYDTPGGQEDSLRQTVMLAEEFLNLMIIIIGERFTDGIGTIEENEQVKREIIHQLCISNMSHSELAKALPEDANNETGLESVVHDVAVFKKPNATPGSAAAKGKYELKEECYAQYNPYFFHYSRSEQSESVENQMKRKRQEGGSDLALPPPVPPDLRPQFISIRNLLHSDIMMHIFHLILNRTGATRSRSWSEAQLERVFHLIGLALHEQLRALKENDVSFHFLTKATVENNSILSKLEKLVWHPNVSHDSVKNLLTWLLKMFAEVRKYRNETVCMDTLEKLSSTSDKKLEEDKKRKAELAAKRRAKIMAQMSAMQKNFIKENAELFEHTSTELPTVGTDMDTSDTYGDRFPIALGPFHSPSASGLMIREKCILCQEQQDITHMNRAMVLAACVQKSTVLSQSRGKKRSDIEDFDPLFMSSDLYLGTHTSTCGHVMHADCWQRYFDAIVAKERRRPLRFRHSFSYDIDKSEFLCPLCECISNTVIPIVPPLSTLLSESDRREVNLCFNDWLDGIQKSVENSVKAEKDKESEEESLLFQPCPISTITKMMAESVAKNFQLLWEYVYDDASGHFSEGMREMLRKFAVDVFTFGLGMEPNESNPWVPIMAWNTCAFTIQAVEQCLRYEQKPIFGSMTSRQSDCLTSLIKFAAVCSQVMTPDTVKQHCIRLLCVLFPDGVERKKKESRCLLDVDMFHYLTCLVMTLPTLYAEGHTSAISTLPTGGLNDQHALQLVITAHIVQILLTYDPSMADTMEMEADAEGEKLLGIYTKLREKTGVNSGHNPSPWELSAHVQKAVLPFLRCAAILFHHITNVPSHASLQERSDVEFSLLCKYLGLPNQLSSLFEDQGEVIEALITSWTNNTELKERLSGASSEKLVHYPLQCNELISLPEDYSDLINRVSSFTCPRSMGDDGRAPTMCLVCGKMVCSQSYCCQTDLDGMTVGAATEHSMHCGAGIGLFLRVRECQVLLLAAKTKGCFVSPPYVDNYGETDQGLRRGNPLHLCEENYKKLHRLWLSHSIPETIAHNLETNSNLLSLEWQQL